MKILFNRETNKKKKSILTHVPIWFQGGVAVRDLYMNEKTLFSLIFVQRLNSF